LYFVQKTMLIGGLQKTTLIDYPGKIAATIFTIGCNFRCSFCHNPEIVKGISRVMAMREVFDFLKQRQKLVDAVCITGGEPTMQKDLVSFIDKIKKMDLLVKLDTNGLKPEVIEKLIKNKLVDYLAMDIKAPWEKYKQIVVRTHDIDKVKRSVDIIMNSGLPHEFRSTVLPALHTPDDIREMATQVKGAEKYFLQQFMPGKKLMDEKFIQEITYTKKQLNDILQDFKDWFRVCKVR